MAYPRRLIHSAPMGATRVGTSSALGDTRLRIWRNFDFVLFGITIILIVYGVLMISSATYQAVDTDLQTRVQRQIQYAVIGSVIFFVTAAIDYHVFGALHRYIYVLLLLVLGATAILGLVGAAGAQRWLTVGIPVQPSELAKLLLVVILAQHLSVQFPKLNQVRTVIVSLLYIGVPAAFIFLQPSLGITILIMFTWLIMVLAAGMKLFYLLVAILLAIPGLPVFWNRLEDYQRSRIASFVSCDASQAACYNINQAAISIGSGGLLGKGYLNGTQSKLRFLRVRHTDFIFSVIAEELGFVGATGVIVLIGLVLWRIMRAAALARDPLGSLICYGVAANIFFQTFVSIGMNLTILPVTGLTLPFISSGGSSLLTLLFGMGLVQSVVMRRGRRYIGE